jgi:hypothetical protein
MILFESRRDQGVQIILRGMADIQTYEKPTGAGIRLLQGNGCSAVIVVSQRLACE